MGIIGEDEATGYIPNATKCMTWQDVKASHANDTVLAISIDKIYGLMSLLALGLAGAMAALTLECLTKLVILRFKKTIPIPKQAWDN